MSKEGLSRNTSCLTFKWRIIDFHACPLKNDEHLRIPKFTSELLDNTECRLGLYPNFNEHMCFCFKCLGLPKHTCDQIELFLEKNDGSMLEQTFYNVEDLAKQTIGLRHKTTSIFQEADLFLPNDTLSVGCCIKKISDKTPKAEQLVANTEISTEKFSITSPIIFQTSTSSVQQILTFPLISVSEKYPNFNIILTSFGYKHDIESLIVQIKMAKSSFRVFAVCKLSIQDSDGDIQYLFHDECWFESDKDGETWELKNSISKQKAPFRSKNSMFTLQCRLSVTDGTYTTKMESLFCVPSGDEVALQCLPDCPTKQSFKEKLRCLLSDGRLCDFIIHVGGKEFPVHKTVLGTVSPVFCAMFERDMKEKENSSLTIEDVDVDTMQRLIDYAYDEGVDGLEWDSAIKLFSAADKYQILELKQICAKYTSSKLSIENVTDALTMADLHQDSYLKNAAENFIYSNFKEVFESEKWMDFMENSMKLANNVMCGTFLRLSKNQFK